MTSSICCSERRPRPRRRPKMPSIRSLRVSNTPPCYRRRRDAFCAGLGLGRGLLEIGICAVEAFGAQDRFRDVAHLTVLVLARLLHLPVRRILGNAEPPHEHALRTLNDLPRFEHASKVVGVL